MGKTVPSCKRALEFEIDTWKGFKKTLISQVDPEAFNELTDICRKNVMTGRNTWNPMISKPIGVSITLTWKKKPRELDYELNGLL